MIGGVLAILGLSLEEERLYEALVSRPPLTSAELDGVAATSGWTGPTGSALARLKELALVSAAPGDCEPTRYVAVPPDVAMERPLVERGEELARAQERVRALSLRFRRGAVRRGGDRIVEVVRGRARVDRRYTEVMADIRRELRGFEGPPYATDPSDADDGLSTRLLAGRRSIRIVYDRTGVDFPGRIPMISADVSAGMQARVTDIPLKMYLVDDRIGILRLDRDTSPGEGVLVVHDPTLLALLLALFELYWERAMPLRLRDQTAELGPPPRLSEVDLGLLLLMMAGLTDREIAANLGYTDRTVRTRARDLMTRLGARTRFQAGYQAVARGWLSTGERPPTTVATVEADDDVGP